MVTRHDVHVYHPAAPDGKCEVSIPLQCGHRLEAVVRKISERNIYELIKWVNSGGKCRQCRKA